MAHPLVSSVCCVALFMLCGCGNDHAATGGAPANAIPERVEVAGGPMVAGFALGHIRDSVKVGGFSITESPITVGDYWRCVDAGVCGRPSLTTGPCAATGVGVDGATFTGDPTSADNPVTCSTPAQAAAYCTWVGGRLPTVNEWMLAARGPIVHRYPWGEDPPSCKQVQRVSYFASVPDACCGAACSSADAAGVKRHPAGASPSGVGDILLTRSELVTADAAQASIGCSGPGAMCLVRSMTAGGIDSIAPAPSEEGAQVTVTAYSNFGFRCVWSGGSQ